LLLIGAIFVPLFGVVLTDYYVLKKRNYSSEMLYGQQKRVKFPAIIAWGCGAALSFALSPLSPAYVAQLPAIGATIPSLAAASLIYLGIMKAWQPREAAG
jgi:purine-cytosine permease-like protein